MSSSAALRKYSFGSSDLSLTQILQLPSHGFRQEDTQSDMLNSHTEPLSAPFTQRSCLAYAPGPRSSTMTWNRGRNVLVQDWASRSPGRGEFEMALFSECMPPCARKLLDTADIVRNGDLSPVMHDDTSLRRIQPSAERAMEVLRSWTRLLYVRFLRPVPAPNGVCKVQLLFTQHSSQAQLLEGKANLCSFAKKYL